MHRQHPQPRVEEPLDQQPVRPLIPTNPTSSRTRVRHNAVRPFSSCTNVAASSSSPFSSATSTSCLAAAQSIPAYRHIPHLSSIGSRSQRPNPEIPLRFLIDKALTFGATSCCRSRHLTTAGTGWSLTGPPLKGKESRPSPGGGRGK